MHEHEIIVALLIGLTNAISWNKKRSQRLLKFITEINFSQLH